MLRALVVSNMLPDAGHPERGQFVRDQVAALRRLGQLDIELYEFPPGGPALARAALDLRRFASQRSAGRHFDVVHAHFGLTAWPTLAVRARVHALTVHGTDISHPRTRLLTRAVLGRMDIVAAVSSPLAEQLPGTCEPTMNEGPSADGGTSCVQVLPCGVDLDRFHPIPRADARSQLGLHPEPGGPFLLFAADPARPEKRHDRASLLARAAGVELYTLGGIDPARVPLWVNAANAVLVPSEREGFGLAVLEALACNVPVLATPVGVHREALKDVEGALCSPFEVDTWRAALEPHLRAVDPHIAGRTHAEPWSSQRMAERVVTAWRAALDRAG